MRPDHAAVLERWLDPNAFARPIHQAVFAAIVGLQREGGLRVVPAGRAELSGPDPTAWRAFTDNVMAVQHALRAGRFGTALTGNLTGELRGLAAAGMTTSEAHVHAYGSIVLELALRREARFQGLQMRLAATAEQTVGGDHAPLHVVVAAMDQRLTRLAAQLAAVRAGPHAVPPPVATVPIPRLAALNPPPRTVVHAAERDLVHTVIADPQRRDLLDRLAPEDFGDPLHATAWRAVGALAERGGVVTAVTVWWEAGSPVAPGAQPRIGAEEFAALDAGSRVTGGAGDRTADLVAVVVRAALIRTARQAADAIATAAGDRRLAPGQVVDAAQRAGQDVLRHVERLTGIRGTTQPGIPSLSNRLAGEREVVPSTTRPAVPGGHPRTR